MVEVAVRIDTELTDETDIMDYLNVEVNSTDDKVCVDETYVENYYEFFNENE